MYVKNTILNTSILKQEKYVSKWFNHELRENIYFGFVLMSLFTFKFLKY
jgi:hypothetical protein